MKNKLRNKMLIIFTLGLFCLNFTPAWARVIEIEIVGGGYRLKGPCTLEFPLAPAAFIAQETDLDIRNAGGQCDTVTNPTYLEITDENGGTEFEVQVTVDIDGFVSASKLNDINNIRIQIQNSDNEETTPDIDTYQGSENHLNLNVSTSTMRTIDPIIPLTLANGTGGAPGKWRIYPTFKVDIPAGTAPDTYTTTLSFTII